MVEGDREKERDAEEEEPGTEADALFSDQRLVLLHFSHDEHHNFSTPPDCGLLDNLTHPPVTFPARIQRIPQKGEKGFKTKQKFNKTVKEEAN